MMEFRFYLVSILAFILVGLAVVSHGASSSEEYWKKELPNTPMPKAIQQSLGIDVGNKGVDVNVGGHGSKAPTNVHVGKGGTSVSTGPKGKGAYVDVKPGHHDPFIYKYASTKTQLKDNPHVALFFLEKDLKLGTQMNLKFTKTTNSATFLPRLVANSIPFSTNRMPEILDEFDVGSSSKEAEALKETIKECEEKGIDGEDKYCATSLESMVDYTKSKLGKNVEALSTYVEKETSMPQKYVFRGVKKMPTTQVVACHKKNYVYAVFNCHKSETTKTYIVSMVGANGAKIKAIVVCHTDTSKWNPKHLAFQVLNVEPGAVPICHFLPQDHVVWIPK